MIIDKKFLNEQCELLEDVFTKEEQESLKYYMKNDWKFTFEGEPCTIDANFKVIPATTVSIQIDKFRSKIRVSEMNHQKFKAICAYLTENY